MGATVQPRSYVVSDDPLFELLWGLDFFEMNDVSRKVRIIEERKHTFHCMKLLNTVGFESV